MHFPAQACPALPAMADLVAQTPLYGDAAPNRNSPVIGVPYVQEAVVVWVLEYTTRIGIRRYSFVEQVALIL
jgi:hypothetical protein